MVRPPRALNQPVDPQMPVLEFPNQELTHNSLEAPPYDPGSAAMISAMKAISTQMASLSTRMDRQERRRGSPSPALASTPMRRESSPPHRLPVYRLSLLSRKHRLRLKNYTIG
ncbi:unnamed protein product [Gordionus sp. m RMFG-2023]